MKLIRNLAELPDTLRGGAVAIGNFDGVHLGHAAIAGRLVAARSRRRRAGGGVYVRSASGANSAARSGAAAADLDRSQGRIARPIGCRCRDRLSDRRTRCLDLSAEDFFQRIIVERLAARDVVEGTNFYFGHGRSGTIDVLRRLCDAAGVGLEVVEPVVDRWRGGFQLARAQIAGRRARSTKPAAC